MAKYDIGTIHETNQIGPLEIVGYVDSKRRAVRFINTGFETVAKTSSIGRGMVKDHYIPTVLGVGYLGVCRELESHPLRKQLYRRWTKMLERRHIHGYGKSIDPEWYCFASFMRDALELKGAELLQHHSKNNQVHLDSDIIPIERGIEPIYSKETCQWVPRDVNLRYRNIPNSYKRHKIGDVFQTKSGPVKLVGKDYERWLVEFENGARRWYHSSSVKMGVVSVADGNGEQ